MVFVRAEVGPPVAGDGPKMFTVRYFDESGNLTVRIGGSRAWRCNNPGNLHKSAYSVSKKRRAIGFAGDGVDEYAVYPDYATSHEALILMLRGNIYSPLKLKEASLRYVKPDPDHIHKVVALTHFDPNRTIKSLNDREFEIYWKAIEEIEGWKVGQEDFIEKWYISGVHKKRKVIYEYLIEKNNRWIAKAEAIDLASAERLHAIVVDLKNGSVYLRPEYKALPFQIVET